MAKLFVFLLLCFGSVYSETQIETMPKEVIPEQMNAGSMLVPKTKRLAWPIHTTPCPPYWPQYNKGLLMTQKSKVQFIQQPSYSLKPVHQSWPSKNPWQINSGWKQNDWPMPMNGWLKPSYGWPTASSGWSKPSNGWQYSNWQPKVIVQKPVQSYLPQYHKPLYHQVPNYQHNLIKPTSMMPDCPPYAHHHSQQTGIIYAPQHQYHPQPQIKYVHEEPHYVKVAKPIFHSPPSIHHPSPLYHHSQPIQSPHVEICD